MPLYNKEENAGLFVAQNIEYLLQHNPSWILAETKYDKGYDSLTCELYKKYEVLLHLFMRHAYTLYA